MNSMGLQPWVLAIAAVIAAVYGTALAHSAWARRHGGDPDADTEHDVQDYL